MMFSDSKGDLSRLAFVTLWSIFAMGFLNGMAINSSEIGVAVTPQTGNIVWMGLNLALGRWVPLLNNFGLFFGFVAGCALPFLTTNLFKNPKAQFFYAWSMFAVPISLYPFLLQHQAPLFVTLFFIGLASGASLRFFRRIYELDQINSAMATGSVMFLGVQFAKGFVQKSAADVRMFWIFLLCVVAFAFGSFTYAIAFRFDAYVAVDSIGQYSRFINYLDADQLFRHNGMIGGLDFNAPQQSGLNFRNLGMILINLVPYFFYPKGSK